MQFSGPRRSLATTEKTVILTGIALLFGHGWYLNERLKSVHAKLDSVLDQFNGLRRYMYEMDPQFDDERESRERFEQHIDPTAIALNAAKKFVASRTLTILGWNNSALLDGEVTAAVAKLKRQDGNDLQIIGSANLIQTLQSASLIDEYNIWTFPVVLGRGKRLFESTSRAGALRLISSQVSSTGVVLSAYAPAGAVPTGSFVPDQPSALELARREKVARASN